jgi:probable phosphoglycerate mutase
MTRIHIVRHGETQWNVEGRMQGHLDSPLTELGRSQARQVRDKIEQIDVVYSSPSVRAVETAEIILNGTQQPINIIPDLKEINLGIWEGMHKTSVEAEHPLEHKAFWSQPSKFSLNQAETFQDVQNRGVKALLDIVCRNRGKSILLVSHTVTIKVILAYFENRPIDRVWDPPFIKNGSYSVIEETNDDQLKVVLYSGQSIW